MAEDTGQDRSEEASPERREEFRKKGQIAVSREITSVVTLGSVVILLAFYFSNVTESLMDFMQRYFKKSAIIQISTDNFIKHFAGIVYEFLIIVIPAFIVSAVAATMITFFQSRFNFSREKLKPDFKRLNPLSGLKRMFGVQSLVELIKGVGKVIIISGTGYAVIEYFWVFTPALLRLSVTDIFEFSQTANIRLALAVVVLLMIIAAFDFAYNFFSMEKKLKMTKQEVKEETKKREGDPLVKHRLRRMAREIANQKMVEASKTATVVVTNPTHYSVALKYELGMKAPVVVAKGVDHLAFKIRETARDNNIPIVENPPLARTLYAIVKIGQLIPEKLYQAVSEVIKYVYQIKGITNFANQNEQGNI